MENNNLSSSTGSLPSGSSPLDNEKIQKIVSNYQKVKTQNALLKKAIIAEQQKSSELDKDLKEKDQALVTAMQEHDVLEFNNQRLTKRLQTIQDQMNEKQQGGGGGSFKFFGNKVELQKKEEEINLLRHELQEKIDDNQNLHNVTNEKEIAYKMVESNLKHQIFERDKLIVEKDKEIEKLINLQKDNEQELKQQTQSLRNTVTNLLTDMKKVLASIKLRDDIIEQINELVKNCINNTPVVTIDYPLDNITPSNERISFESLVFDKDFSVDTSHDSIQSLLNIDNWRPSYRSIVSNIQSIFSQNLTQLSSIIGSHNQKMKLTESTFKDQLLKLNESLNQLTLEKEENAFTMNTVKDDLSQKESMLSNANRDIRELKDLMEQLSDSNREYELQVESDAAKFSGLKTKLETELEELKNTHKNEVKQLSDQHQGLLKHQKNMMNSKFEEQRTSISQYEKKVAHLQQLMAQLQQQHQQQLQSLQQQHQQQLQQQQQQQQKSPVIQSSPVNLMDNDLIDTQQQQQQTSTNEVITIDNNNNINNNTVLSPNGSLIDLSFFEQPNVSATTTTTLSTSQTNSPNQQSFNSTNNSLIDLDDNSFDLQQQLATSSTLNNSNPSVPPPKIEDNIVVTIPNLQTSTNDSSSSSNNTTTEQSTITPSGRFKLNVLDDFGEQSDSLNFSFEDKEREKEMKIYYENKITQLLNKISNIDAKTLRYYEQYQTLLKKGQFNENVQKELEKAMKEAKETKEELEITRVNYDQQMKMLTEQYISLNESLSQLDTELIKIKQHKILCAKCRAWNPLENVFAPDNHQLLCYKGNHPLQTITN